MPIEINDCDGGIGTIIETRGWVMDEELIDSFNSHLAHDKKNLNNTSTFLLITQN